MARILHTEHNPEAGLMAEIVKRDAGKRGVGYVVRLIDTDNDDMLAAYLCSTLERAIERAQRAVCMQ